VQAAHAIYAGRCSADPLIIECASYHTGPNGIETGVFLPHDQSPDEIVYILTTEEQSRKRALVECFTSQRDTLCYFSLSEERFRVAPKYDFTQPPHPAPVWYDRYPWDTKSDNFCLFAAEALHTLRMNPETTCR
jgi:hypothetical protein